MGKVKEYLCEAFEDICIAEKVYAEEEEPDEIRARLANAIDMLAEFGGFTLSYKQGIGIAVEVHPEDPYTALYDYLHDEAMLVLDATHQTDAFETYREEYFRDE